MNQVFKVTVMIDGKPDPSQKEPFMFISSEEGDKACDLIGGFLTKIGIAAERIDFKCEIQEVGTALDFYNSMMDGVKRAEVEFLEMKNNQAKNWGSSQN